jgi:hypothetical protein
MPVLVLTVSAALFGLALFTELFTECDPPPAALSRGYSTALSLLVTVDTLVLNISVNTALIWHACTVVVQLMTVHAYTQHFSKVSDCRVAKDYSCIILIMKCVLKLKNVQVLAQEYHSSLVDRISDDCKACCTGRSCMVYVQQCMPNMLYKTLALLFCKGANL